MKSVSDNWKIENLSFSRIETLTTFSPQIREVVPRFRPSLCCSRTRLCRVLLVFTVSSATPVVLDMLNDEKNRGDFFTETKIRTLEDIFRIQKERPFMWQLSELRRSINCAITNARCHCIGFFPWALNS